MCKRLQLTAAGRNGRRGRSAASRVVEVRGHAVADVTVRPRSTEVASVMESGDSLTPATTHLVQVTLTTRQWRFYVGARGHRPPNLAQPPPPNFFQGNLGLTFPHVNRLR